MKTFQEYITESSISIGTTLKTGFNFPSLTKGDTIKDKKGKM